MKVITFKGQKTPFFISQGFHAQYIFPVAKKVCIGEGVDIGCGKEEWCFPDATPIEKSFSFDMDSVKDDAHNLPKNNYNYIFSSHCLEHLDNYVTTLNYWVSCLKTEGVLFLYLPHPDCLYWRPHYMPTNKHIHQFYPKQMIEIFKELGLKNIFCSERDLSYSFAIYGYKKYK